MEKILLSIKYIFFVFNKHLHFYMRNSGQKEKNILISNLSQKNKMPFNKKLSVFANLCFLNKTSEM